MSENDKRLIEDYLPIDAISEEAVREKSVRQGHISTLHLWWARRPLVAMRAAVYATLVGAPRDSAERAAKATFVKRLCKHPGNLAAFEQAQREVLEAHAERTRSDGSHPKVLDMFAGGGAIPLEVLRLGGEAFALELNPVAYLIELCTLEFPQTFGSRDTAAVGSATDKTWAGLVEEVRFWGTWVLGRVREEIGNLYPAAEDPQFKGKRGDSTGTLWGEEPDPAIPTGYLVPVAYLWTRTVRCKRPGCEATVPLARQTWLCRKEGKTGARFVAVRTLWDKVAKRARFHVVQASSADELDFDPGEGSRAGSTVCPNCQSPIDHEYVKAEGRAKRFGSQLLAIVCDPARGTGRRYVNPKAEWETAFSSLDLLARAEQLARKLQISVPDEPLEANPRSFDVQRFGFDQWRDVFTPRQLVAMVAFAGTVRAAYFEMLARRYSPDHARAVATCLSMVLGRLADYCTSFCTWQPEFIKNTFHSPGLPMIMDFAEANPLADSSGGWPSAVTYVCDALSSFVQVRTPATVVRGSALSTPWEDESFDAIVTDPPYYDSRSYSNLSDHFYVWHKRAVGHLYPEHFASQLTPKKSEAIAAPYRHGGVREKADAAYEQMMQAAFAEARRLLKPGAPMVCVYAHKTTAGWATLINALRAAGFSVVEAWPVEMERKARQNALETAALASSILLITRRREGQLTSSYEKAVRPELEAIVRERVETLWDPSPEARGVQGADLVVAAVGAGLRAFTRFARVDFENGEEVPAERFLAEVETVVLETILSRLFRDVGGNGGRYSLAGLDPASRFYLLWRYTYRWSELDAGEAIIFANGTHVELDGPAGLATGTDALVEKKKGKFRLRDFTERGKDAKLGLLRDDGQSALVIDALHRILWLMENRPLELTAFLREAQPNLEQMRLVAQALVGPVLKGGALGDLSPSGELAALAKLMANWNSVVEEAGFASGPADQRKGQYGLGLGKRERR